jgi:outer membrane protein assembly factor BamD (BamD/ComL family)
MSMTNPIRTNPIQNRLIEFMAPLFTVMAPAVALCCLLMSAGCGEDGPEQLFAKAESAAEDSTGLGRAVGHYREFLQLYPQHAKAAAALKQLAVIAQQRGEMDEAIATYQRLIAEYPDSGHGDEAQFMIAFIFEEYLRDFDRARAAYQLVIDRYPDSELAASAQRLLPHVGRAPEEWVDFQDGP